MRKNFPFLLFFFVLLGCSSAGTQEQDQFERLKTDGPVEGDLSFRGVLANRLGTWEIAFVKNAGNMAYASGWYPLPRFPYPYNFQRSLATAKGNEAGSVEKFNARFLEAVREFQEIKDAKISIKESEAEVNGLIEKVRAEYEDADKKLERKIKEAVTVTIVDESGLYSREWSARDLEGMVSAHIRGLRAPDFKAVDFEFSDILPASSLEIFEENVREAGIEVSEFKGRIDSLKADVERKREAYRALLSSRTSNIVYEVSDNFLGRDYDYQWNFPETQLKNGEVVGGSEVVFEIEGADLNNVLPGSFVLSNEDLRVEQKGNVVGFINQTGEYVTVNAVSLYYGGTILTIKPGQVLDLPPHAKDEIKVSDFNLRELPNDYYSFTMERARNTEVNYGYGVRYTVTGSNEDESLFRTEGVNLAEIL